MSENYLFFNLFLTLIKFGLLKDSSEWNQTNTLSPFKHIPVESKFLQNKTTYHQNVTENTNPCGLIKNAQFRLSDKVEQRRTPSFRWKIQKPYENSNINLSNVNLTNPQIRLLRKNNNNNNINLEQSRETIKFERDLSTSPFKYTGNKTIQNLQYVNVQIPVEKSYTFPDNENNIKETVLVTDSTLLPIVSEKNEYVQVYSLDKVEKTEMQNDNLYSRTVLENFDNNTKSEVDKVIDYIISEDNIKYIANNDTFSAQESMEEIEDIPLSLDTKKFKMVSENVNGEDYRRSSMFVYSDKLDDSNGSESGESDLIDYTNWNLNNIYQQPLQSKDGMTLPGLGDTNPLLIESFRICYACSSGNDVSCLKPNRQTTVKYCHKDNEACVVKSYRIGSTNYLTRDCASSCKHSHVFGVVLKYESCSICHSDLCNSAYSISISIVTCFLLFAVITVCN